mgnify:FL=1
MAIERIENVRDGVYGPNMNKNESLVVDCDQCVVRSAAACQDCFVTVLLGVPVQEQAFDADEVLAIQALSEAGMVPPLRLVVATDCCDLDQRDLTQSDEISNVV